MVVTINILVSPRLFAVKHHLVARSVLLLPGAQVVCVDLARKRTRNKLSSLSGAKKSFKKGNFVLVCCLAGWGGISSQA